jgi:hypothetical protein
MIRRLPGVDVILVGDQVEGMTPDRIISAVASDPVLADVPVFLIGGDEELIDAFGDRIEGAVQSSEDLSPMDEVFTRRLEGDRAEAAELASRSAAVLADLGRAGKTDISSTLTQLADTLMRPDEGVALPAIAALDAAGDANQVAVLSTIVADADGRSDEMRVAAANAIAGIAARHDVGSDQAPGLAAVVTSDASLAVRQATARALGNLRMGDAERAGVLQEVRVNVASEE